MASRRVNPSGDKTEKGSRRGRPATTPEGRENQMIAMATDLAERQLRDGTASSQVISHFLKLGSSRERLEQERIGNENRVLVTKAELLESGKRTEELYGQALEAMRAYTGQVITEGDGDEVDRL